MITRLILVQHGASHHKDAGVVGGPRGCRGLTAHVQETVIVVAHAETINSAFIMFGGLSLAPSFDMHVAST
jgi:probable phosphoglycerate mutase